MTEPNDDSDKFYKLLGLIYCNSESPNLKEIKKSYRDRIKTCHPDKTNGDKVLEELFKSIDAAYKILINPETARNCIQCKKCLKIMPLNFKKEICNPCDSDKFYEENSKTSPSGRDNPGSSSNFTPSTHNYKYQKSDKQQPYKKSKEEYPKSKEKHPKVPKQYCIICTQEIYKPNQQSICSKCINTGIKCSSCNHIIDAIKVGDILIQKKILVSEIKCYKCLFKQSNYNHKCQMCSVSCSPKYNFCQNCYHQSKKCCNSGCYNRIKNNYFIYLTQQKRVPVNKVKCTPCLNYY